MHAIQPEADIPPERQAAQAAMIREALAKKAMVNAFASEEAAARVAVTLRLPFQYLIGRAR
jgi:hypothetical protein